MDEADKLLDEEFVPLVDQLISYTPKERQMLLFSATFPIAVKNFKDRWLEDAHEINLMSELTLEGVTQFYAFGTYGA
jgi:ATP-dependent RNA helicase DDX6/DHH1